MRDVGYYWIWSPYKQGDREYFIAFWDGRWWNWTGMARQYTEQMLEDAECVVKERVKEYE